MGKSDCPFFKRALRVRRPRCSAARRCPGAGSPRRSWRRSTPGRLDVTCRVTCREQGRSGRFSWDFSIVFFWLIGDRYGDSWELYDLFFFCLYSCWVLEKNMEFNRTIPTKFRILPCGGMACWDDDRWVFRVQQLGIVTTTGIIGDWLTCSDFEEMWWWMDTKCSWSVYDMRLF